MPAVSVVKEYFRVGDRAPTTGTYRAIHSGHRKNHNVIVIRDEEFPRCRFCKDAAVFLLLEATPYVTHDLDFAGPSAERKKTV